MISVHARPDETKGVFRKGMTSRKPPSVKKPQPDSFLIKLGEPGKIFTIAEMRSMAMRAFDLMEADGIEHLKPSNFYGRPVDENGQPIVRVRGHELRTLVIKAPYRSVADEYGL